VHRTRSVLATKGDAAEKDKFQVVVGSEAHGAIGRVSIQVNREGAKSAKEEKAFGTWMIRYPVGWSTIACKNQFGISSSRPSRLRG
jgi:hypothetical protein